MMKRGGGSDWWEGVYGGKGKHFLTLRVLERLCRDENAYCIGGGHEVSKGTENNVLTV